MAAPTDARVNLLKQGVPGLLRMLVEIAPTVTGTYYKGDSTVADRKKAYDAASSTPAASMVRAGAAVPARPAAPPSGNGNGNGAAAQPLAAEAAGNGAAAKAGAAAPSEKEAGADAKVPALTP